MLGQHDGFASENKIETGVVNLEMEQASLQIGDNAEFRHILIFMENISNQVECAYLMCNFTELTCTKSTKIAYSSLSRA